MVLLVLYMFCRLLLISAAKSHTESHTLFKKRFDHHAARYGHEPGYTCARSGTPLHFYSSFSTQNKQTAPPGLFTVS